MYDSTDGNGDTKTVGYDLDTKSSFELGSLPAQLPEKLPDPDQTGETRALIQAKQTSKEGESEIFIVPQDTNTPNATGTTTATSTVGATLDMTQGTATVSTPVVSTNTQATTSITSYASSTPVSQDVLAIPDVVIPPFISTSTPEIS